MRNVRLQLEGWGYSLVNKESVRDSICSSENFLTLVLGNGEMGKFQILHTRGTKPKLQNYVLILEIYGRLLE